jgi:accessory gene regulator protein AgrB
MPGQEPIERLQTPLDVLGLHVAGGLSVFVYNDPSTEDQQIQYTKYQNSFKKQDES